MEKQLRRKAPTRVKPTALPPNNDDILGEDESIISLDLTDMERGVSITWLAQVFRMDKNTVKKRIAPCDPVGKKQGHVVYSLRQACAYLVQPKVDIGQWIKNLRPNDLPPYLQAMYWDALLKRQKWEENAGDLWRTEIILDTFGELAMTIKSQVQLWVENVDRIHNLNEDQRKTITDQSDILLSEIHRILIESPSKKRTPNQAAEIEDMLASAEATMPIEEDDV